MMKRVFGAGYGRVWGGMLAMTAVLAGAARANEPARGAEALLRDIERASAAVTNVFAEFEQERHIELFEEPLRTEGVMIFEKPGKVRWETVAPYRSILLADGKAVEQYEWTEGAWRRLKLGAVEAIRKMLENLTGMWEGRMAEQKAEYDIAARDGDPVVVTMTPKSRTARQFVRSVEVRLSPDLKETRQVTLTEPNGDRMALTFRRQRLNAALPPGAFDTKAPAPVEEIRRRVFPGETEE